MKKRIIGLLTAVALIIFCFAGCSSNNKAQAEESTGASSVTEAATGLTDTSASTKKQEADTDDESWKSNTGSILLGTEITYEGDGISVNGSTVKISKGGDYTVTGILSDGMIYVDTGEKVKLRLNGVNITNKTGPAILFYNTKKSFITLEKGTTNTLTDGSSYSVEAKAALFSNDTLEIKGEGSLNVYGNYKHAIASDDDIIIEEGAITISKAVKDGFHANDMISVTGGTLDVTASKDGLDSEGDISVIGGITTVKAGDDAIHADNAVSITDGSISIKESYEGVEGKASITIDGGNIRINSDDDGLNAGSLITLNGGYIYTDSGGDGYDSNGDLTINGGTHIIYSGNNANGPLDNGDRGSSFIVNGGTVLACGGSMGIEASDSSKQFSLWINQSISSENLISISDSKGNEIVTFLPAKSESLTFFSSDKLASGESYTISTGGSHSGNSKDTIFNSGSYTKGTVLGTVTMSGMCATYGSSQGMGRPGGFRPR